MISLSCDQNDTKGGIIIPIIDFITTTLNLGKDEIKKWDTFKSKGQMNYSITLKIQKA